METQRFSRPALAFMIVVPLGRWQHAGPGNPAPSLLEIGHER